MNRAGVVKQVIRERTGERPERCRLLDKVQAAGVTKSVWWAKSRDRREWVIVLTPDPCRCPGPCDCVKATLIPIDRSELPDDMRRAFGLDR